MKDEALSIIKEISDPARKLNILREYLQALVMRSLHESEAFLNLSFVGGTALRFLYGLPRFSEDLDFSLEKVDGYAAEEWMKKVKRDLSFAGFDVSVNWNDKTTVHKAWIKIGNILYDAGLAAMRNQKLSIKLEIDSNPPAGAHCNRTIVTKQRILAIQHHDIPSLFAGKLHALITRSYQKGRDWYDLLWYMGQRPQPLPNLIQLQNALNQSSGNESFLASDWRQILVAQLDTLDISALVSDVAPFLEHPNDTSLMTHDNINAILTN